MKQPIIGILGGLGPAAGADLFQKIIENTIATCDQDHLSVALLSYADIIPDRSTYINDATQADPVVQMYAIMELLQRCGATVAAVPCVTAHAYPVIGRLAAQMQAANFDTKLLLMPQETASFIKKTAPHIQKVGALGTIATRKHRLFYDALIAEGITPVYQSDEIQDLVQAAIFNPEYGIKAVSYPVHPQARLHLETAIAYLKAEGAEAVILGCTELPLAITEPWLMDVMMIDPTLALAKALIQAVAPHKLKA
jgi:aspartate racemase